MTGAELKTFTTELLDGTEMDDTTFYTLLNIAKDHVENMRYWRILSDEYQSSWSTSDAYTTQKDLPTNFIMLAPRRPVKMMASNGAFIELQPSPWIDRHKNRQKSGYFVISPKANKFSILGSVDQTYTVYIYYTASSTTIASETSWAFPSRFHPFLAYLVSALQKGGIDYDDIFARMAPENRAVAEMILKDMEEWDDGLQRVELGY